MTQICHNMRELDNNEKIIIKELIKNPRISDNQIAKNTGLAVKSVNRKRKRLEEDNIIFYFTHIDNSLSGTGSFSARQLYILDFKQGTTRAKFIEKFNHTDLPKTLQKTLFTYLSGRIKWGIEISSIHRELYGLRHIRDIQCRLSSKTRIIIWKGVYHQYNNINFK